MNEGRGRGRACRHRQLRCRRRSGDLEGPGVGTPCVGGRGKIAHPLAAAARARWTEAIVALIAVVGLLAVPAPSPALAQSSVMPLGSLSGANGYSSGLAVSSDGSVAAGYSFSTAAGKFLAYRWSDGTMTALPLLRPTDAGAVALGISGDGNTVVGCSGNCGLSLVGNAFRWTAAGGTVALPELLGALGGSVAYAANSNGSVIVGSSSTGTIGQSHAVAWTGVAFAPSDLGTLEPGNAGNSNATAVDAAGNIAVGESDTAAGNQHATLWSVGGGAPPTDLGTIGGAKGDSIAWDVNAGGAFVVGGSQTLVGDYHAFRWSAATGMSDLGTINNQPGISEARAISADGSIVVGQGTAGTDVLHAFRWTAASGMLDLNTLLSSAGVNMTGVTLVQANGLSSDGGTIVGTGQFGTNPNEAYVARYLAPGALAAAGAGPAIPSPLVLPTVTEIGTIQGATGTSTANGISADGSTIVGSSSIPSGAIHAFAFDRTSGATTDLGTIGNSIGFSIANAVDANGGAIVGESTTPTGSLAAFLWTKPNGMTSLGFIGGAAPGAFSDATGIDAAGNEIVGESTTPGAGGLGPIHAFLYNGAMNDLGTLGAATGSSVANGVSADGSTVVGESTFPEAAAGQFHAFRYPVGGAMQDLGTIGGVTVGDSVANAVNGDGSVVVGGSIAPGGQTHAFRWTAAGGMADLGFVTPAGSSVANALDGAGDIIVGNASLLTPSTTHAFRWTAATGMQDMNLALTNAGVSMTGITLSTATGVSGDGQFIVGQAIFGDPVTRGYIVRYCDATDAAACGIAPGPPIAGVTTPASLQASADQVSDARRKLLVQEFALGNQLLGANERIWRGNEAGVFAAGGTGDSEFGGGSFHIAFGNGLSLLGGASLSGEHYERVNTDTLFMGALALRYVYDNGQMWRPYAEAGGWGVPDGDFQFSRTYMNGADTATGAATASGDKFYAYGRLGAVVTPSPADEGALSLEFGRAELRTDAFGELISPQNPFNGYSSAATDGLTIGKVRGQWTHSFADGIDATFWVGGAHALDASSNFALVVSGVGTFLPNSPGNPTWAEYGGRVGYQITPNVTLNAFADGVSGDHRIGTDVRIGASLNWRL